MLDESTMPDFWPHQRQGLHDLADAIMAGGRRICVTSPTGGGKSRMMQWLAQHLSPVTVLCHRKALMEQLSRGLTEAGIKHGLIASGYAHESQHPVQLAMKQTLATRLDADKITLPPSKLLIDDEAHADTSSRTQYIHARYLETGTVVVGVTATPVGIGHLYDELIVAGRTSDLRKCGALVLAETFAPDEPDIKLLKKAQAAEFIAIEDQYVPVVRPVIFGRVLDNWRRLNPDERATVLFAPDVDASLWFAQQLTQAGVPSAHICAKRIWWDGCTMAPTPENRDKLRKLSESGACKIICNRFVLREGIDWPHLAHCVFACTFGSIPSYIQAGGRVLRYHPDVDKVIIQDHGGNYWRHDSLNSDRHWRLTDDDAKLRAYRRELLRSKTEPEPVVCPQCGKVRMPAPACPACGFTYAGRKRTVIQTDGKLKVVEGDIFRPPRYADPVEKDIEFWKRCVYGARKGGRSFAQARGLFAHERQGREPGPGFPLLPTDPDTWLRPVKDVDFQTLT